MPLTYEDYIRAGHIFEATESPYTYTAGSQYVTMSRPSFNMEYIDDIYRRYLDAIQPISTAKGNKPAHDL